MLNNTQMYDNDDWYCDYDDFAVSSSQGSGGGRTSRRADQKNKAIRQKDIYSSKHVRARNSHRARRKATTTKAKSKGSALWWFPILWKFVSYSFCPSAWN